MSIASLLYCDRSNQAAHTNNDFEMESFTPTLITGLAISGVLCVCEWVSMLSFVSIVIKSIIFYVYF